MTVMVGVIDHDGIIIGADRMASSCSHKLDQGPKIFEREGWAYANTGDVREIQIFEQLTKERRLRTREEVISLAASFYEEMKKMGLGLADRGEMPHFNSAFLVAVPDGLFYLAQNFAVYEYKEFHAGGIGREYALGVLFDGYGKRDAVELAEAAIKAANAMNPHCGGGPDIVRVAKRSVTHDAILIEKVVGEGARK